jgi:hypothetical protein
VPYGSGAAVLPTERRCEPHARRLLAPAFRRSHDSIADLYTYDCTAADFEYDSDGSVAASSVVPVAAATAPAWRCVRRWLRPTSRKRLLGDERPALGKRTRRMPT